MFWDNHTETLDRGSLEQLQLSLLQQTVERARQAPFYADVFSKNGITAAGIKSLDDLRRIPFITKDDLREHYPYGFLAVSRDKIVRMHSSSGTSGSPTVIFHTMQDIRQWSELIARCMYMTGVRESDVFQNMTGLRPVYGRPGVSLRRRAARGYGHSRRSWQYQAPDHAHARI